ncbi:MAG: GC-type dockerin domain-anchored protein [Phycisphaerae bacterium]|nr:GC-type dockerin domain-anchored protein [Phycisphaerae bacterium]
MNGWKTSIAAIVACTVSASVFAGSDCPADITGDRQVDGADLANLLGAWSGGAGPADLNGDGAVDAADLAVLLGGWGACPVGGDVIERELAAVSLTSYPHAAFTQSYNSGSTVHVAVDPAQLPATGDATVDVFVLSNRSQLEWDADPVLVDVRGAPDVVTFGATAATSVKPLATDGLAAGQDLSVGRGYDLVVDLNRNGVLDGGDLIDGRSDAPGFWKVVDLTQNGPLSVSQINSFDTNYPAIASTFQLERLYYPTDIQNMDPVPLIVISHGNGHNYTWYDYLGQLFASWGYIVMSHQNNTQAGIEAASGTTLNHTAAVIALQASIGGGAFNGKLDSSRIIWIGHSRGGEGVVRAYDRIVDGTFNPPNYGVADIKLISSIAPTDFLGTNSATPHGANYHLMYGSADGDVCGCPDNDIADSFNLYERSTGERAAVYVHGADHNDFNCCGVNDFSGPAGTQIGRTAAQLIAKGAYLALVKHFIDGDVAAKEYLWRQYEDLRPVGVDPTMIVDLEYRDPSPSSDIIDDFQTNTSTALASSGAAVAFTVTNPNEGIHNDANTTFTWLASDPRNGMVRGRSTDLTKGFLFDWNSPAMIEWAIVPAQANFADDAYLSLRAAQTTRHPNNVAINGAITFTVTLVDINDVSSSINIGAYKGGVQRPYLRTGFGTGSGWQNEFETIRIRPTDFLTDATGLDLTNIKTVRLSFGEGAGSVQGRLGIDDLMLDKD